MTFTQEHLYTHISSIPLIAFLACVLKKSAPGIGKPFVTQCEIALQKDGCLKLPLLVSPCLLNFYAENIMKNAGLEEAQAGVKISRRNIYNLRYADDTTLMAESEEELKSLSMKENEESEKVGLKLNIQKTKIMASGPITLWQIDGETVETVSDFIFGAPKSLQRVTAAMKLKDTYSLEGKL